jgi:hypothetical protein
LAAERFHCSAVTLATRERNGHVSHPPICNETSNINMSRCSCLCRACAAPRPVVCSQGRCQTHDAAIIKVEADVGLPHSGSGAPP